MLSTKIELSVERTVALATEKAQQVRGGTRAYETPELHVVGAAGELVQGNFGYTGRDGQYYWS